MRRSVAFLSVVFFTITLGAFALLPTTDNSVFARAWEHAFPGTKPLIEQPQSTQVGAKQYGESVLWAAANPEPTPPAPGESRELILSTGHGLEIGTSLHDQVFEGKHWKAAPGTEGKFDGLRIVGAAENLTFRDCVWEGFGTGINLSPGHMGRVAKNIRFERCIVINSTHGQSVYAYGVQGLVLDQSVFDLAGWRPGHPEDRTMFDHNLYINNGCTGVVVTECWLGNPASYNAEFRCGVDMLRDCVMLRSANGLEIGGGDDGPDDTSPIEPGGVWCDIQNVAILGRTGGNPTDASIVPLSGMFLVSNSRGGSVQRLVIAGPSQGNLDGWHGWSVVLAGDHSGIGVQHLIADVDVCGWPGEGERFDGGSKLVDNQVTIRKNDRTVNLATYDAMLQRARARAFRVWDESYSPRAAIKQARAELGLAP